ncbi:MAG: aromatic-ring-hydroxylating dioxygenase subunit beta [Steroidobacteraceae bacterium]
MADTRLSESSLAEFVYREARLLDEKHFEEWYGLFTDDGRYWMPLTRGQPDGETHTSLFFEDKLLLKVRIERMKHPNAYSQQQPSFCQHVLQKPAVEQTQPDLGEYVMRTPFMYLETQLDRQTLLSGVAYHRLVSIEGALRIRQKKIELVNCDAALPSIQLLL